jgi:tetratricopeptide (TPR) repeat protein
MALRLSPRLLLAYICKAEVMMEWGEFEKVVAVCDTIIGIDCKSTSACLLKGRALVKLQRYKEGAKCFQRVLKWEENSCEALLGLSDTHVHLLRFTDALSYCDDVLRQKPKLTDALYRKAHILVKLQKNLEAIKLYDGVIREVARH